MSFQMRSLMPSSMRSGATTTKQQGGLPVSQTHSKQQEQGLRRRLSSLSLKIQPSPEAADATYSWVLRRSKSVSSMGEYAGSSIRKWWDWGCGWILSRKPTFARDLEMNEQETAVLGCHSKGSWRHVFYKLRKLLVRPHHNLPQTFRIRVDALPYDYSATLECLENPHKPQYSGGIVVNPELDDGLKGWTVFGDAKIEHRASKGGNTFVVARHRHESHDSFSQKFQLEKGMFYTFSAWLQVSQGNAKVAAMFKTSSGFEHAGWVVAKSGCWSMLKGGLVVNASGPSHLYFESNNTLAEIWADSISLQPFTEKQWRSHQHQSIDKNRKSSVKLIAMDDKGNPLANATFSIKQQRPNFPFGCAMNKNILTNTGYQN